MVREEQRGGLLTQKSFFSLTFDRKILLNSSKASSQVIFPSLLSSHSCCNDWSGERRGEERDGRDGRSYCTSIMARSPSDNPKTVTKIFQNSFESKVPLLSTSKASKESLRYCVRDGEIFSCTTPTS